MVFVDGHYYAYRSFYAIASLTNSQGEPTNAAYGFASALLRIVEDLHPAQGAVIFDGGVPAERMALHPAYKANRKETPEALERQFPLLHEVAAEWGVSADRVPELLALTGDSADNFPGVPGVGPKTAAKWILQHGTSEKVLAAAPTIAPERFRPILQESAEIIRRNRKMVELRTSIPLPRPVQDLAIRPDPARQVELFRRLEFKRFTREAEARLAALNPQQPDLFGS